MTQINKIHQLFTTLPPIMKKPVVYILLAFVVWMVFFDSNDLISQFQIKRTLKQLQAEKEYYIRETEKNQKEIDRLMNNPDELEEYARSRYLMKRDNEDIYLILNKEDL